MSLSLLDSFVVIIDIQMKNNNHDTLNRALGYLLIDLILFLKKLIFDQYKMYSTTFLISLKIELIKFKIQNREYSTMLVKKKKINK